MIQTMLLTTLAILLTAHTTHADRWRSMMVPGTWEESDHDDLADYDGIAWYRAQVRVSASWKDRAVQLAVQGIDNAGEVYFQGEKIGSVGTFPPRYANGIDAITRLDVPDRLLEPGNLHWVAIRIYDHEGRGGFKGAAPVLAVDNEAISMKGEWEFHVGDDLTWAKPAQAALPEGRPFEDIKRAPEIVQALKSRLEFGGALKPEQALQAFKVSPGLAIDLLLHEPLVEQPVFVNFDERGRLWVVQYRQYPLPAGVKMLSRDRFWRAVYDKIPPAPPNHVPGKDRITIHEDTDGDGVYDTHKTFLEGLNITTACEFGRGGVWVLNPPYLLFYPDKNRDDVPDGDPEVHLAGFGLEDTHSVANSLCWGPDGWLYAAQGSTVTGNIVRPGLDKDGVRSMGQLIWRYHPETRRYEIFAEGGGNAFGCEFDAKGRVYSGHNGGDTRGFHYVQGAYYQKGFTKHGPLSNPYAFGFFAQMQAPPVERFTHTFIIYEGGKIPSLESRLLGVAPLESYIGATQLIPQGSTFRTEDVGRPVQTSDGFFKPVDIKLAPDGSVVIADWYDFNVNHYRNHEGNIDPYSGRIYRLRSTDAQPAKFPDLAKESSAELVHRLRDPNEWVRRTAQRLLADRKETSLMPALIEMLRADAGQPALEAMWAIHNMGGWKDPVVASTSIRAALAHSDPHVRRWAVRLLGDERDIADPALWNDLLVMADKEHDLEAFSQIASSAKRLPAEKGLRLVEMLLAHDELADDPHLPLLLWWAIESKIATDRERVLALWNDPARWSLPVMDRFLTERLMRRFAVGSRQDLLVCADLLNRSPSPASTAKLLTGFEQAFAGRSLADIPTELAAALARQGKVSVPLGLRLGRADAVDQAVRTLVDPSALKADRLLIVQTLGEVDQPSVVDTLINLLRDAGDDELRSALLTTLGRYPQSAVGEAILQAALRTQGDIRTLALTTLASRADWSARLLADVDAGSLSATDVPVSVVRRLAIHKQDNIVNLVRRHWGEIRNVTTAEAQSKIDRTRSLLANSGGTPYAGYKVFAKACAKCHKLFTDGGDIGPDLTSFKRSDLDNMLLAVIHPSAEIREGFESYQVLTVDGRALAGFIADEDTTVVVLRTAEGQTLTLPRDQIDEMEKSPKSLMPDGLLDQLSDEEVRDLFAYLRSTQPLSQ
jgi:putative membrane-bound dehydrogenase-like protein